MVELIQGEAKTLRFTLTDSDGTAIDISSAEFVFGAKYRKEETDLLFVHSHGDFNVESGPGGVVTLPITTSDTSFSPGEYAAQLQSSFYGGSIDISDIEFTIVKGIL